MLIYHIAAATLCLACFLLGRHLGETGPMRQKQKERKAIEARLPKAKIIKLALLFILPLYSTAQSGFLIGMGAGYSNSVYAELRAGYKAERVSIYYNQVAELEASRPAYFGIASGYDLLHTETYKITANGGYYYRLMSVDTKGRQGGNYAVPGIGATFTKDYLSITTQYIGNTLFVGLMVSGLLGNRSMVNGN